MNSDDGLRVLHVVRPALGGMKEHVLQLCQGLREQGHSIELACPRGSEIAAEAAALGFEVHEIVLVGPLRPLSDLRGISGTAGIVRRGRFDVIHAHGFKAGLVARLGAVLGGCKTRIVTIHGHIGYAGGGASRLASRVYIVAERSLARITSRIIAVSEALRTELIQLYRISPDRVITVHNGVDVRTFLRPHDRGDERTRLGVPSGRFVVGTAARFAPQKGLQYFIDAAVEVGSRRDDSVFVLGGDGPLRPDLEGAVREAGAESLIWMPGFIDDMPAFLGALDVYVSPSLTEGLPLTLIQAGAAGCPVVGTDVGGTPEVVQEGVNGLLVPSADAHELAGAVERLLDDATLRSRLGVQGRRIATTEFTPEVMVQRTLNVYSNALAHR